MHVWCTRSLQNALLRLPSRMPLSRKLKLVKSVIKLLNVEAVQHTLVGSVGNRGISGGERKRVNIGMELVADPTVLFLVSVFSRSLRFLAHDACSALH